MAWDGRNKSLHRARGLLRAFVGLPGGAAQRVREHRFPGRVRHISGPVSIEAGPDELVVVCLVRDGAQYLDAFLEHYRALGAKHIVLLDNGSTDGTLERASAAAGVTVLHTDVPYRTHKVITKRYLLRRFGPTNWVLCVDIDEFFDFPHRHRLGLGPFLEYLNEGGYTAVAAHLLDLFPRGALARSHGSWRRDHRFYDLTSLERSSYREVFGGGNRIGNGRITAYAGGIRLNHFGVRAMLTKHPLQFPSAGVEHVSSHVVRGANVADISAVLLHYKYVDGFLTYAERIVRERSFFRGSAEYRKYLEVLAREPRRSLYSEDARELHSVDQLVDEGFLVLSDPFLLRVGRS